jgi:hypothetical protein
MGKPRHYNRHLTSALIDLIIKLPEHEQEHLLKTLQESHSESPVKAVPKSACDRSGDYASGRYFYWDLFCGGGVNQPS